MPLDVPKHLQRGRHRNEERWVASAVELLHLVARAFDRPDLSSVALLDVGCGTKFTKVILEESIPIRRYVGVDIAAEVISFLHRSVDDPRFSFHHLDAHNDLYNPGGRPLEEVASLPVGDERFDVITLFSVFTHLPPADYRAMLRLLRPHVALDGGLLFSLFIDEGPDPEQQRAFNQELRRRRLAGDPAVIKAIEEKAAAGPSPATGVPDFVDRVPDRPMLEAVYSEPFARSLFEGTGWEVVELRAPQPPVIQHHFICRPA